MPLKKAYALALIFAPFYPIRWWEGRPMLALLMLVLTLWFLAAGYEVNRRWFIGYALILGYELFTLPKRVQRENDRIANL